VRHGCIILALRLCQPLEPLPPQQQEQGLMPLCSDELQQQQEQEATQAIIDVAQRWMHTTGLAAQVPAGTAIILQVGGACQEAVHVYLCVFVCVRLLACEWVCVRECVRVRSCSA